jgi:hypothetical protein
MNSVSLSWLINVLVPNTRGRAPLPAKLCVISTILTFIITPLLSPWSGLPFTLFSLLILGVFHYREMGQTASEITCATFFGVGAVLSHFRYAYSTPDANLFQVLQYVQFGEFFPVVFGFTDSK